MPRKTSRRPRKHLSATRRCAVTGHALGLVGDARSAWRPRLPLWPASRLPGVTDPESRTAGASAPGFASASEAWRRRVRPRWPLSPRGPLSPRSPPLYRRGGVCQRHCSGAWTVSGFGEGLGPAGRTGATLPARQTAVAAGRGQASPAAADPAREGSPRPRHPAACAGRRARKAAAEPRRSVRLTGHVGRWESPDPAQPRRERRLAGDRLAPSPLCWWERNAFSPAGRPRAPSYTPHPSPTSHVTGRLPLLKGGASTI